MQKVLLVLTAISSTIFASESSCFEIIANLPLSPVTCNGDLKLTISGFYWSASQEGLEFALKNKVRVPVVNPTPGQIDELNNLIDDDMYTPGSSWEFGFKLGLGYNTVCDGWDLNLLWTRFRPNSHFHASADVGDNETLVTLWSAFAPIQGEVNFARDIDAFWRTRLDLVDGELGREFWVSKRMSLRPFIGVRYARLDQEIELLQKGGSWSPRTNPNQSALQNEVFLNNDFYGFGVRGGLDLAFHLGCGFRFFGDLAPSIVYGRFKVLHEENNRLAISPHTKAKILETRAGFRASRAILDLGAGIEWSAQFCECSYGITTRLGYEEHLFFHQNQLWRVVRIGDVATTDSVNNSGENVHAQTRGTFDTRGWTLTFVLSF